MTNELIYAGAGLLLIILVVVCVLAFRKSGNEEEIDTMSGTEFEDFMAEILHRSGVEVLELTKTSGDFGADNSRGRAYSGAVQAVFPSHRRQSCAGGSFRKGLL